MKNTSYADEIATTKVMLSGLKSHTEKLTKHGIDDVFIADLEVNYGQAMTEDNEQEAYKARLKEKTSDLGKTISRMQKKRSHAKKIVKLVMPKESWKEFGIDDKK
ncbi:MAG: hypothetical protein GXY86_06680 [Firmicutes bacterium]|nr:hypothetical protein [Bacillota bacterium]